MKGAQDWLTVADGAVEDFLRQRLAVLFPTDTVIGEEGGGAASDTVWIIDPIDGTSNFARGDRNWRISIGFLLNCVPTIGIVAAPVLDELYVSPSADRARR
jgi:myo-inositol-1(or 4)-monophosphatase